MVGGGTNRVANAADRQSVGVRVDARARRPPQRAPVRACGPHSGLELDAIVGRVGKRPTSARVKLSGKNFHLGMRIGAWRKSVPLSHCMCCSAQIDAMVKPQFQDFAEQAPCSRVVCT